MKIMVTDLTRFTNASKDVCLAGIDIETGKTIRPMIQSGSRSSYLPLSWVKQNQVIPGSILESDFKPCANTIKPHTEDHIVHGNIQVLENATSSQFEEALANNSVTTILEGFGALPQNRLFHPTQYPKNSLFTLKLTKPEDQFSLIIDEKFGEKKFKAHITDGAGFKLNWLPVTDLGFFIHLNDTVKNDPNLEILNRFLHQQQTIYLRIGLARPWGKTLESTGCWTQLNGIYSFPDFRASFRTYG